MKKIIAVLLIVVSLVAIYAMAINGAENVIYAGKGEHELDVAEVMNEYFGEEDIVKYYWPVGAFEISEERNHSAAPIAFSGVNSAAGGEYSFTEDGLPENYATYTGVKSQDAFGFTYSSCADGAYYSFNAGSQGQFDAGLVIEFDILFKTREDGSAMIPGTFVSMGPLTTGSAVSGAHNYQMLKFTQGTNGKVKISGKELIQSGEWAHITIVYVHGTTTVPGGYYVYLGNDETGRTLVASFGNDSDKGKIEPSNWRIMAEGVDGRPIDEVTKEPIGKPESFYFDNVLIYKGSKVHNPFATKEMTSNEIYELCLSAVCDEDLAPDLRYIAYTTVNKNIAAITSIVASSDENSNIRKYYNNYEAFAANPDNINALKQAAITANCEEYNRLAKIAESYNVMGETRTLENISQREKAVAAANEYIKSVGDLFEGTNPLYIEATTILAVVTASCEADKEVNNFIGYMTLFDNNRKAGFLTPMQKYYDKASEIFATLPDASVYGPSSAKAAEYIKAREFYLGAGEDLARLIKEAASTRFMQINEILIATMAEDKLLSDAKYRRMWDSAFIILASGDYDPNVEGMAEAVEAFYAEGGPHEFFWNIVQQEHVTLLSEKIAGFEDENTTYIDRAGICKYVTFYVEENALYIDEGNEVVKQLVDKAKQYEKLLPSLESDYRALLLENTENFMAAVDEIETYQDYATIKSLHDAAKEFYYAMEIVGGEDGDVMRYVLKYEALEDWLKAVEIDCILYIEVANRIPNITDGDELYRALVTGYGCTEMIDDTYVGVPEAKTIFEEAFDSFEDASVAINEEIYQTVDTMCSVRMTTVVANIVDFFRSLFN